MTTKTSGNDAQPGLPTPWDFPVRVAFTLMKAATDGFVTWNRVRQQNIVKHAKSLDEAKAALQRHRELQRRLVRYLELGYALVGTAADGDPAARLAGIERLGDGTDRYRLESHVAGGSEGEVWSATDGKLQRTVAVKLLHDDSAANASLLLHGRALACVSHPNVVTVYDVAVVRRPGAVGTRDGLVMEYVAETLENRLRRRIGRTEVRQLGRGVLEGLAALHAQGVFHRDLSPRNMLVSGIRLMLIDPRMTGESSDSHLGDRGVTECDADLLAALDVLACMLLSSDYSPEVSVALRAMFRDRAPPADELRAAFETLTEPDQGG